MMNYKSDLNFRCTNYIHCSTELYRYIFSLLTPEMKKFVNKSDNNKYFLGSFIGNLYFSHKMKNKYSIKISLHKDDYLRNKFWKNETNSTYNTVSTFLKYFEKYGFIEVSLGKWKGFTSTENNQTTFTSTEKLLNIFERFPHIDNIYDVIHCRTKKINGVSEYVLNVKFPKEIEKRRSILQAANNMYASFKVLDSSGRELETSLFSVYNDFNTHSGRRFGLGGRFYGKGNTFQILSKEERKKITINGNETVELDFKCLHINMLYAMKGKQFTGDAYNFIDEEARPLAKLFILMCLNNETKKSAIQAMNNYMYKEASDYQKEIFFKYALNWNDIFENMVEIHKPIAEYICNPDLGYCIGKKLQNIDSKIIESLIEISVITDDVILPIHDSIIVNKKKVGQWYQLMKNIYSRFNNDFDIDVEIVKEIEEN